ARLSKRDVRALVIPLAPNLANGDYTVRWRVASTDGHLVGGVFAIGVGAGRPPPQLATSEGSSVDSGLLVARFLYFIGLLVLCGGLPSLHRPPGAARRRDRAAAGVRPLRRVAERRDARRGRRFGAHRVR